MMNTRVWLFRTALGCLTLALATEGSPAQDRIPIEVSVALAETSYRDALEAEDIDRFERGAAALLAQALQAEIAFLSFKPESSSSYRLVLRLDGREGSAENVGPDRQERTPAHEVGLHATLEGPGVGSETLYWMVFRPKGAFADRVGTADELLLELELKLSAADYGRLSQELLSKVSIGESAAIWEEPLGWILPYQRSQLCVDTQSRFEIVNLVSSPVGRIERRFIAQPSAEFDPPPGTSIPPELERLRHHLFGEALPDQDRLDELKRAVSRQAVEVKRIYIIDYLFSHSACEDIPSPDEAFDERGDS